MTAPIARIVRALLDETPAWPRGPWDEERWNTAVAALEAARLETLFFERARRHPPPSFPEPLFRRLQNTFESAFAHAARLGEEAERVRGALLSEGIRPGFLKGYPLSRRCYPHPACRRLEDVDCFIEPAVRQRARAVFKRLGYSALPGQSRLETKTVFLRLQGPHVFAFEIHRSIHTSYRRCGFEPAPGDFDSRGEPSAEILFCSILLHHKFFESTPRDYVDLHFLLRGVSRLDWARIERLLGNEALLGLARVKERLNFEFLGEERKWRDMLPPAPRSPGLRLAGAAAKRALEKPPPGRGARSKFCDAFMVFFVYDRLRVAREVFVNKYFRYVLPVKYLRFLFPSRRAPTRTPHVRNNGIPERNGT